jgi:PPOX class probable F420-dependent enzyme
VATKIPTSHRDLLDQPAAVLATVGADGRPQQSVVWFLASEVDGETVVQISLHTDRQKTRNLRARPVIDLVVVDSTTPMRYIEVRGDAEIADDPGYQFADRIGAKYGVDLRQFDGPVQERVVVTIHPTVVHAVDMTG